MAVVAAPQSAVALATELAKTLGEEDVPVKLRCALCNKLAVNAFRLPCCEQNICETCNSSLPQSCPICEHSPLNAAKPLKTLRLTILAFVKNVEKKREKERASAAGAEAPATPITPAAAPTPAIASIPAEADKVETFPEFQDMEGTGFELSNGSTVVLEEPAVVQSIEVSAEVVETLAEQDAAPTDKQNEDEEDDAQSQASDETQIFTGDERQVGPDGKALPVIHDDAQTIPEQQEANEYNMYNNGGYGYNGVEGGFAGMDYNEMQQQMMQQMQQMQAAGWNGYPNMMGMPGMNPMDMSGMFGGYGMHGMGGMNPMAMMNGMTGMDFSGGYGTWNNGQQLNGDFGASTGFYPGGGYNHQGHVPQISQHQQYPKNNNHNQNRFPGSQRGHGRGGFYNPGRGQFQDQNFGQAGGPPPNAPTGPKAAQVFQSSDDAFQHQLPNFHGRQPSHASSNELRPATGVASHDRAVISGDSSALSEKPTSENNSLDLPGNTDDELTKQGPGSIGENIAAEVVNEQAVEISATDNGDYQGQYNGEAGSMHGYNASHNYTTGDLSNSTAEYAQQVDYNNNFESSFDNGTTLLQWQQGRGGFRGRGGRGGFRGRGGAGWQYNDARGTDLLQPAAEPKGVGVEGAPTGPKALREGKPNTGWSGISRGRGGFAGPPPAAHVSSSDQVHSRIEKSADSAPFKDLPDLTTTRTATERVPSPSRSHSRSRSQSRSRSRSRSRRRHRHRSVTPSESDHERKRERRRHRSSRKRDGAEESKDDNRDREGPRSNDRSQDVSVDDKYRSSRRDNDRRRSHRDTSKDRRRHKHRSRSASPAKNGDIDPDARISSSMNGNDVDSDKKQHRDKYRDRSRDRDREKDRHRDKDRDKKRSRRDRSRSADSDHDHRSSRRSRKEKERDRDRERDRSRLRESHENATSARSSQPQTPIEPEAEFKIQGRSKDRPKPTPTGPASMQPPTGPRAAVGPKAQIKMSLGHLVTKAPTGPKASSRRPSQPPTPTSANASASATPTPSVSTPVDPYEEERKKAYQERLAREELRRKGSTSSNTGIEKKRSWSDTQDDSAPSAPTGPKGDRDRKDRGGRDDGGRSRKSRRTSYKYEDDETDEQRAVRVEREREASRWD